MLNLLSITKERIRSDLITVYKYLYREENFVNRGLFNLSGKAKKGSEVETRHIQTQNKTHFLTSCQGVVMISPSLAILKSRWNVFLTPMCLLEQELSRHVCWFKELLLLNSPRYQKSYYEICTRSSHSATCTIILGH